MNVGVALQRARQRIKHFVQNLNGKVFSICLQGTQPENMSYASVLYASLFAKVVRRVHPLKEIVHTFVIIGRRKRTQYPPHRTHFCIYFLKYRIISLTHQ